MAGARYAVVERRDANERRPWAVIDGWTGRTRCSFYDRLAADLLAAKLEERADDERITYVHSTTRATPSMDYLLMAVDLYGPASEATRNRVSEEVAAGGRALGVLAEEAARWA